MTDRDQSSTSTREPVNSLCESKAKKVSRLLQFQALVFVAIATGAGTMWNTYRAQVLGLHPCAAMMLGIAFWIGLFLWFLATCLCFWAIRRHAWGESEKKFRVAFLITVSSLSCVLLCLLLILLLKPKIAPSWTGPSGRACLDNGVSPCDVIIVGAGIAGLSAAKELQHLNRSVLILEANNRIGGRAYVGYVGNDKIPIDYGGAWIHGIPTNPLTPLVDSMGFKRERTEFDLPYFVNDRKASPQQKKAFDRAVEEYEEAVKLGAKSVEDQHAMTEFACSAFKNHVPVTKICHDLEGTIPFSSRSRLDDLCHDPAPSPQEFCKRADKDLLVTSDVAERYVPDAMEFRDIIPLLAANAGPLESAAELSNTSAVDSAKFESGEDDLIDKGMGGFVKKLGEGLPVCLNSPVTEIDYSGNRVKVSAGGRVYEGSYALVTVSVGVLKKKKIAFKPELPKEKLDAIHDLQMGNMQKVIVPLKEDIFSKEPRNSWILYEGDLSKKALAFAKEHKLPLVNENRVVMGFVIKPLNKNIAIGFFGGDWATALESQCENKEHGSGKSNPNCDDLSIEITESALSNMSGEKSIDGDIQKDQIQVTRWSLDSTSYGAYSVAEPGSWYQRGVLAEPVEDTTGTKRLFFAGEGTARAIYNGSYPGAYESGLKAARDINAAMTGLGFVTLRSAVSQEKPVEMPAETIGWKPAAQTKPDEKGADPEVSGRRGCGQDTGDFNLKAGSIFENLRAWKEAEDRYLAAGGDACSSAGTRKLALEGVQRAREHGMAEERVGEELDRWGHTIDSIGGWLLRMLIAAVIVSVVWIAVVRIPDAVSAVEVARFATPADESLASQVESAFVKARAKLLNTGSPFLRSRGQITIPIDPGVLSDLSFEAGGFKVASLASLSRLFFPPLFRITGGGHVGAGSITFHAQIWQRRRWFNSILRESVIVDVPSPHGLDIVRLEDFVYAIFLRVLYASR